jgi:isoleucyl-tRNA synthetase
MYAKDSVHLQDFPKLTNFEADKDSMAAMDMVRAVCSCALSVRDKNGLRVRLPLNRITVVARDIESLREFSAIIADEINVKSVEFLDNVEDFAENRLILNFQRIGSKVGPKMPELIGAAKSNRWKITENGLLRICDVELAEDEFSLQLIPRRKDIFLVENYNILIVLDLTVTEELKCEGAARDFVRLVQQLRKNAAVDIATVVELSIKTKYKLLLEAIAKHGNYIKEQILASVLTIIPDNCHSAMSKFSFREEIEGNIVEINFNTVE